MTTLNLKKKRVGGRCDVIRCLTPPAHPFPDGVKLCAKHAPYYPPPAAGDDAMVVTSETVGPPITEAFGEPTPAAAGPDQAAIVAVVQPIAVDAEAKLAKLTGLTIQDPAKLKLAGPVLQQIKGQLKDLETQRKQATAPLVQAQRVVNGWFKPATNALKACEKVLKDAIAAFAIGQEQAKVAALKAGDHETAMATAPAVMPEGISTRTVYKWSVSDLASVPREFMTVDATKVAAAVAEHKGDTQIPGIHVYADITVASASARS